MNKIIAIFVLVAFSSFFVSQQADAHHITAHVPVASSPMKMSITDNYLYVSHMSDQEISVIDTRTNLLHNTITTSAGMIAVAAVPDKNKIYAAVFEDDGIDVYDLDTGVYQKTIILPDSELLKTSTGGQLYGQRSFIQFFTGGWSLDYNPNNELLYVANYNGDTIQVIDTRVDQVMETIPVAGEPFTVKVDPISDKVLVASLGGNAVTIIDYTPKAGYSPNITHWVSSEIKTSTSPWCLDIDSTLHYAFVAHRGSSILSVINTLDEKEIAKIQLPGRAQCVTVDESEHRVYVSLFTSNEIVKINAETFKIIDTIETTGPIWDIIADPNSHNLYASHQGLDEILVLSPQSLRETLPVVTKELPIALVGFIDVHGQDVRLMAPSLNIEDTSIESQITTQDGGDLTVEIPCNVLVAQDNDGQKSEFEVTIDDVPVTYEEIMDSNACRSISFFVPENSRNLQIKGTDVLVEQPSTPETSTPTPSMELTDGSKLICKDKVWMESTKGKIACVFPSTAQKLVERGWGTILS